MSARKSNTSQPPSSEQLDMPVLLAGTSVTDVIKKMINKPKKCLPEKPKPQKVTAQPKAKAPACKKKGAAQSSSRKRVIIDSSEDDTERHETQSRGNNNTGKLTNEKNKLKDTKPAERRMSSVKYVKPHRDEQNGFDRGLKVLSVHDIVTTKNGRKACLVQFKNVEEAQLIDVRLVRDKATDPLLKLLLEKLHASTEKSPAE
jgi:hypothetical protein